MRELAITNPRGDIPMRFMMLVKASKDSEAGRLPTKELVAAMGVFNDEMAKAGVMSAATSVGLWRQSTV